MTETYRTGAPQPNNATPKVANDLTPRKTMLVLVIVVGCFAVLWPKVFYPMMVGSANQYIKPSPIDKTTGCCDVISELDVNTIKIMSELCSNIVQSQEPPLTGKEIVSKCRSAVLETCGIDISAVLQEQVRLGQSVRQILDEIRSLNGSLCLKYNFGVAPWRLGVPHLVNIKVQAESVRQERPPHLRTEMVHPAFRERGRAIPQAQGTPSPSRPPPRIVEGRPGPIPGMRPTMGGPGHVVQPSKQGAGSMGLIMPIYTIGIVIFFTYTVMKVVFKKQPSHGELYPHVEPDRTFRKEVFETERMNLRQTRDGVASKIGDAELDQLRRRLRETELAMERIVEQMAKVPLKMQQEDNLVNGNAVKPQEPEQASVKIVGMETTASCEGGQKWSRPGSPVVPNNASAPAPEPTSPPQEIYLEGALPPQSQLLVADSATEEQKNSAEDETPVVLAGKMTLSVISLDSSENGNEDSSSERKVQFDNGARSSSNVSSEEFEKIDMDQAVEAQIDEIIEEARSRMADVELVKEREQETNDDVPKEDEEIELETDEVPNEAEITQKTTVDDQEDDEQEEEVEEDDEDEVEEVEEDEEVEYEESGEEEDGNEEQEVVQIAQNGETVANNYKNHVESDSASQSEDEDVEVEEIIEYVEEEEDEEESPDEEPRNANGDNRLDRD